jgi:hypothetical protein
MHTSPAGALLAPEMAMRATIILWVVGVFSAGGAAEI